MLLSGSALAQFAGYLSAGGGCEPNFIDINLYRAPSMAKCDRTKTGSRLNDQRSGQDNFYRPVRKLP